MAIDMIAGFSELLRYSLKDVNSQLVLLSEELDSVKLYLDIEKIRFKKRLTFSVMVPDELLNCVVPSFIILQLAENSIKHGITKFKEAVEIQIKAYKDNQKVGDYISKLRKSKEEIEKFIESL